MKKSWIVVAAVVPLVVLGSVAVWKASGNDARRQGALESEAVALSWRGDWISGAEYTAGNVVSHDGASYVADGEKFSTPTRECTSCGWKLVAVESPPKEEPAPAYPGGQQDIVHVRGTDNLLLTPADRSFKPIPGLTQTVNVAQGYVLYVYAEGSARNAGTGSLGAGSAGTAGYTDIQITIFVDGYQYGGPMENVDLHLEPVDSGYWSRAMRFDAYGKHTIDVRATHVGNGDNARLYGVTSDMDVIVLKKG